MFRRFLMEWAFRMQTAPKSSLVWLLLSIALPMLYVGVLTAVLPGHPLVSMSMFGTQLAMTVLNLWWLNPLWNWMANRENRR